MLPWAAAQPPVKRRNPTLAAAIILLLVGAAVAAIVLVTRRDKAAQARATSAALAFHFRSRVDATGTLNVTAGLFAGDRAVQTPSSPLAAFFETALGAPALVIRGAGVTSTADGDTVVTGTAPVLGIDLPRCSSQEFEFHGSVGHAGPACN